MSRPLSLEAETSREVYLQERADASGVPREFFLQDVPLDLSVFDVMALILLIDGQYARGLLTSAGLASMLDLRQYLADRFTAITGQSAPPLP